MNAIDKRPGEALLSDLLPYVSYDKKTKLLWLKDGSATKTFKITPKDTTSFTEEDLENLRSGLSSILSQVPENTFVQFFLIREKTNEKTDLTFKSWKGAHTDQNAESLANTLKLIQNKKESLDRFWERGLLFQTRIYVTIRVLHEVNPKLSSKTGAFAHLIFNRDKKSEQLKLKNYIESETAQAYESLKQGFNSIYFETSELEEDEILETVFRFLNPDYKIGKTHNLNSKLNFSEQVTLSELIESKRSLTLGRTPLRIGTLKTAPESAIPALMRSLATLSCPFYLVLTFLVLPQTQEKERLSRKQRLTQGMASGDNVRNLHAETQLHDIEETLSSMISSGEKLLAMSAHSIVFEEVA